jgi:salicylate biosynthesis isochorismate synthase/menaquinone-specific isochorismate synthase
MSVNAPSVRFQDRPFALAPPAEAALERRLDDAIALARRAGDVAVASVTQVVDPALDFSAAVLGSRRADDRFFCMEQPGREGHVVCGLGTAWLLRADGPDRFDRVAAAGRELGARTIADDPAADPLAPAGSGPVQLGGFAFSYAGGRSPEWAGFEPAQLVLPEVSFARRGEEARMTVAVAVEGDESRPALMERVTARLAELRVGEIPLIDPDPVARPRVAGAAPPAHYEEAVRRAIERIRAGELEKVVLAREVRVIGSADIDPAPVFDGLRAAFGTCYCYCVGGADGVLVGASPELLVRRDGARAQTVALAGTTRRSADPAVDDHLGEQLLQSSKNRAEQAIVTQRIERALDPVSVWVAAAGEPVLVKVQNVQHLGTPIRAQLSQALSAVELAGLLHPTPAVGGEPTAAAEPMIPALEGLDRGWYAGAIGWTDLSEDGEFCVALRCALLRGPVAHLYVGCGIVADSVPAEELAETEVKLEALLPLLV